MTATKVLCAILIVAQTTHCVFYELIQHVFFLLMLTKNCAWR
jgi:hypothetical protein